MLLPSDLRLLHRHGDDWGDVHEVEHHDAASHDTERTLLRGGRIFRCHQCDEEWIVTPASEEAEPGAG